MDFYRVKPKGRYVHECPTCGVFTKAKGSKCMGCILDLLDGKEAGEWRKQKPKKIIAHAIAFISRITTA